MVSYDTTRIAYVEFHDAHLAELRVRSGRSVGLIFSALNVFEATGPERFDIWVYRCTLSLEGVEGVRCRGRWEREALVTSLLVDKKELGLDVLRFVEGRALSEIDLTIFGGASIEIEATSATLTLDQRDEFLESWVGPLVEGSS